MQVLSRATVPTAERRGKAFTLIELLVVISIIALLIAILLPALSSARDAAKSSLCLSRLKSFALITHFYQNDYKNYAVASAASGGYLPESYRWATLLKEGDYLPEGQTQTNYTQTHLGENYFLCPGVDFNNGDATTVRAKATIATGGVALNYHTLAFFGYGSHAPESSGGVPQEYRMKTTDTILDQARQALVAETFSTRGPSVGYLRSGSSWNGFTGPHPGGEKSTDTNEGTTQMAFMDGHAENKGPVSQLQTLHAQGDFKLVQ